MKDQPGSDLDPQDGARENLPIEVVEAELVDDRPFYYGRIVSVHKGFSFISEIKRGFETIATNGDVFCPSDAFAIDALVKFFDLNSDPKRPGKFRVESVEEMHQELVVPGTADEQALALAVFTKSTPRSAYHRMAKQIDEGDIEQAAANRPFANLLADFARLLSQNGEVNMSEAAENFLNSAFPSMEAFGLSHSLDGDVDVAKEDTDIERDIQTYQAAGMTGQVESIKDEYSRFKPARQAFTLMKTHNMLKLDMILPDSYLPEMLMAAPVWFVDSREQLPNNEEVNDPFPDKAVIFFSDLLKTQRGAWLYQIYNRRTRRTSAFSGKDILPPKLMEVLVLARQVFDFVAIATPYHDQASREWADPKWLRNLDPFLLGFMKGLPFIFVLGRWSGTGLFPLFLDMVADTVNHLRQNKHLLKNFSRSSYWYKGAHEFDKGMLQTNNIIDNNKENNILEPFANELIKAFDEGYLFEWLRGEEIKELAPAQPITKN